MKEALLDNRIKIGSVEPESSIDFPGKYGPVIFMSGCNCRCPACHNPELAYGKISVEEEKFEEFLKNWKIKTKRGWYDGACISGGEPTIHLGLIELCKKLKNIGLEIKVDTNGSNPSVLNELLEQKLVSYVAMDIKGPKRFYDQITNSSLHLEDVEKGMQLVTKFPDYEYRTTIVPVIRDKDGKDISFLTCEEVAETAKMIYDCTGVKDHKYFLQRFVPAKTGLLDKRLESFPETTKKLMEESLEEARRYLHKAKIRD